MSDGDALLAAILDNPEENLPRLAYADWLDEMAMAKDEPTPTLRAEFIRLQCKMAGELCSVFGDTTRQGELFVARAYGEKPPGFTAALSGDYFGKLNSHRIAICRRGFFEEVHLSIADFWGIEQRCPSCEEGVADYETNVIECRRCESIGIIFEPGIAEKLASFPITKVRLVDREPVNNNDVSEYRWWCSHGEPEEDRHSPFLLPYDLFSRLPLAGSSPMISRDFIQYASVEDAHNALSIACVAKIREFRIPMRATNGDL